MKIRPSEDGSLAAWCRWHPPRVGTAACWQCREHGGVARCGGWHHRWTTTTRTRETWPEGWRRDSKEDKLANPSLMCLDNFNKMHICRHMQLCFCYVCLNDCWNTETQLWMENSILIPKCNHGSIIKSIVFTAYYQSFDKLPVIACHDFIMFFGNLSK